MPRPTPTIPHLINLLADLSYSQIVFSTAPFSIPRHPSLATACPAVVLPGKRSDGHQGGFPSFQLVRFQRRLQSPRQLYRRRSQRLPFSLTALQSQKPVLLLESGSTPRPDLRRCCHQCTRTIFSSADANSYCKS